MPRARRRTTRKRTAKKPWWKPNPMSRASRAEASRRAKRAPRKRNGQFAKKRSGAARRRR